MSPELALAPQDFESRAISPLRELGAYEALWDDPAASFKVLSEKFAARARMPCLRISCRQRGRRSARLSCSGASARRT